MILQTNDHVTFIKSIIRNASEEGRCVNEIESEEIANSLKAMLQECDDLENYMVTANQNTIFLFSKSNRCCCFVLWIDFR